jgi:hypothetical protein
VCSEAEPLGPRRTSLFIEPPVTLSEVKKNLVDIMANFHNP